MRKRIRIKTGNTNEQLKYLLNCNRDCTVTSSELLRLSVLMMATEGVWTAMFCSYRQSHVELTSALNV
jgi:hypothetical protein